MNNFFSAANPFTTFSNGNFTTPHLNKIILKYFYIYIYFFFIINKKKGKKRTVQSIDGIEGEIGEFFLLLFFLLFLDFFVVESSKEKMRKRNNRMRRITTMFAE